jgi:serine/threonine-protein kinase
MATEPSGKGGKRPLRIGRYQILRHLASGGMGAVYKALDTDLNREVALKVLPPETAANPKMLERFRREAKAAGRLRHENVVAVYEFGEAAGTYFLALEFIDGIDLHEYIVRRGKLNPDLARDLLKQAAKALAHAHSQGIVHRDIKPSNFLITEKEGQPLLKLTDLGLARHPREDEGRVTRDGTTVGTVDYMSPEQALDSGAADIRSDLYSLGCTFYHMLSGRAPFHEGSLIERLTKHANIEPPDIRQLNADVPDDLVHVLEKLLRKSPQERYQTPLDLLRDLLNPEQIDTTPRLAPLDWMPSAADRRGREGITAKPEPKKRPSDPDKSFGRGPRTPRPDETKGPSLTPRPDDEDVPGPARKRWRDDEVDEPRPKAKRHRTVASLGWLWVGIALAVVIIATIVFLIVVLSHASQPGKVTQETPKNTRTATPGPDPIKQKDNDPPKTPVDKPKVEAGPGSLYPASVKFDPARLHEEFDGPLAAVPAPDPKEPAFTVGRLSPKTATTFPTLAEAVAAAPEGTRTVIAIADNGPLFVSDLAVSKRDLVLRAADGFLPLLVWDTAADKSRALLSVQGGNLTLIGLELVAQWPEPRGEEPAYFVRVTGGDFIAQNCTFSVAGKHPRGFVAARLDADKAPGRCRLGQCLTRGDTLTALQLLGKGWDVEIDDSLLVCGAAPLVQSDCPSNAALTLRVLRSTLVTAKHAIQLETPASAEASPPVRLLLLDSLLGHSDPRSQGDLLSATGKLNTAGLSCRAVNCVYAGWTNLVGAAGSVSGDNLKEWGRQEGEKTVADVWPRIAGAELEEAPTSYFVPKNPLVYYVAVSQGGLIGAPLEKGYSRRGGWVGLAAERFPTPAVPLPTGEMPAVPKGGDGFYHGEKIDFTKDKDTDLGKLLERRLANAKPAPRIVLVLTGGGEIESSPIRLKGVDLVVYGPPSPTDAKTKPLTLVPNRLTTDNAHALFDIENGNLELINVRILYENKPIIMPSMMVRVQGGDLRLHGCWLQGPLDRGPETYGRLIEFHGSGRSDLKAAHVLACQQSVLLSGKEVIKILGGGARLRINQSLLLAAQDLFDFAPGFNFQPDAGGAPVKLNVQMVLENNTLAVRRNAFHVHEPLAFANPVIEPVVVQAERNLFADPFSDEPRTSCLLDLTPRAMQRGLFLWQGKANAYDGARWYTYVPAGAGPAPQAQWQQLWGKAGERESTQVIWPVGTTFAVANPQLDRLRLPPKTAVYGADLSKLGIGPKKK